MKLNKYDNKKVRIIDNSNNIFEGRCTYNNREYNYHEFGIDEESLEILNVLFYKSNIKKVKLIKEYVDRYSKLEEIVAEDAEEILNDEEVDEEAKIRLRNYLKDNNID